MPETMHIVQYLKWLNCWSDNMLSAMNTFKFMNVMHYLGCHHYLRVIVLNLNLCKDKQMQQCLGYHHCQPGKEPRARPCPQGDLVVCANSCISCSP